MSVNNDKLISLSEGKKGIEDFYDMVNSFSKKMESNYQLNFNKPTGVLDRL